jgi:hypothetical protein
METNVTRRATAVSNVTVAIYSVRGEEVQPQQHGADGRERKGPADKGPSLDATSIAIGLERSAASGDSAWLSRGTLSRSAPPAARSGRRRGYSPPATRPRLIRAIRMS